MIDPDIYRSQAWQGLQRADILPEMDQPPGEVAWQVSEAVGEIHDRLGAVAFSQVDRWGMVVRPFGAEGHPKPKGTSDVVVFSENTPGGLPDELEVQPHNSFRLLHTARTIGRVTQTASIEYNGRWVFNENGYTITEGEASAMKDLDRTRGASLLYAANAVLHVARMVRMVPR